MRRSPALLAGFVRSARRLAFVLLLLAAAPAWAEDLDAFARRLGLADAAAFAETVRTIRAEGRLPARYLDKRAAARLGWRPGSDLCRIAPGRLIGGDRFGNREGRLPEAPGRRWTEADLDYGCGARNARRLVFSSDRLIYVTVDHYESFHRVPP